MFDNTIKSILYNIWPMVFIVTIILVTLRLAYLLKTQTKFVLYKEILALGFALYVMVLFYVVTFQDVSWSSSNFIPLKEMFRYSFGSFLFFKNIVGNMIMFLPYGFFVSYFLRLEKPLPTILLSFVVSCTIETVQLIIGRVFDVDDIILNVIGGTFGFYLYHFVDLIKNYLPKKLNRVWVYNISVIMFLIFLFFYLYQLLKVGL